MADLVVTLTCPGCRAHIDATLVQQHHRLPVIGYVNIEDRPADSHGRGWRLDFVGSLGARACYEAECPLGEIDRDRAGRGTRVVDELVEDNPRRRADRELCF